LNYYENLVKQFNEKMKNFAWKIYLFWAHIFSQHLLFCWLNTDKIIWILDNSDLKNWRRLYWTSFKVNKPDILRDVKGGGKLWWY
jgi:hypothetical protein